MQILNGDVGITFDTTADFDDVNFNDINHIGQHDIAVSLLATDSRPATLTVTIKPVPWFLYDPLDIDGYPSYVVQFIQSNAAWLGVGNIGNAVGQESNRAQAPSQRSGW
jgi:hypothetical protein